MARRRSRPLRVFVSHTSELAEYPAGQSFVDAACAGVRRVDAVPVTMIDFGAHEDLPLDVCRDRLLSCDVHLSVIGFRYGSPIPERADGVSYIEFEFEVSTAAGLPRLVFLIDEYTPLPPALVDHDRARISRFRQRVRAGTDHSVAVVVGDPGRLEAAVSQALIRIGGPEAAPAAGPWMLPAPGGPVVDRPELAGALLAALTPPAPGGVEVTTALEGAGGCGKSTLAGMVCRRPEVRERFPGGLLWLTIGEHARGPDLARMIGELCAVLSGESPATGEPMLAGGRLGELLDAGEPKLLVIDDVWREEQLAPFLIGGASCRRLVTTRNAGVVPRGSPTVVVAEMTAREARATLTAGLGAPSAGPLGRLLDVTGRWPVLLGLVNAALVDKVQMGATVEESAEWALGRLAALGPTAFDVDDAGGRSHTVAATIQTSMDLLSEAERDRYVELTVFPEDADIPGPVVAMLWRGTAGMAAADAERLRARLVRLRLVGSRWSEHSPALRLHDVLHAHLRHRCTPGQVSAWSRTLVEEARRLLPASSGGSAWWLLPRDAGYLWRALPRHLAEAGLGDELDALVGDLRWLEAKIERTGSAAAAEADLRLVETPGALALRRAVGQASHLLTPMDPPGALGATLASRLDVVPELRRTVAEFRGGLPSPQLAPAWPLPDQAPRALVRTLAGHHGGAYGCAFSADGTLLATTGCDRTVRLWDVATGRRTAVLRGHEDRVYGCAFSPDGALLASVGEDRTVRLWDLVTGETRMVLSGHTDRVSGCAFSPDGALLATTGGDQTARIWNVRTGQSSATLPCHDDFVIGCAFTPEGVVLICADEDRGLHLHDPRSDAVRPLPGAHAGRVHACALSPDGALLATVGEDRVVRLWETAGGRPRGQLAGHTDRVYGCAFSPDGALLASASWDGTVRLWDVAAAAGDGGPAAHTDRVSGCAFSPDGALLASASWDRTARLWSVAGATMRRVLTGHRDRVSDCSLSPDGMTLATAGWDGTVRLWDVASGDARAVLTGHTDRVHGCAFSSSGEMVASAGADGQVRLWDARTGAARGLLAGHAGAVHDCAFAPGDSLLASAGVDGRVRLWDPATGEAHASLHGHVGWVFGCAFSPDGSLLASAGVDAAVRVWDVASGAEANVLTGHRGWAHDCAFSPDGALLVSAGADGATRVWDPRTGRCRCALRLADRLLGCAWHPSSDRVCVVGARGVYLLSYRA